jgi:hypothetical protein
LPTRLPARSLAQVIASPLTTEALLAVCDRLMDPRSPPLRPPLTTTTALLPARKAYPAGGSNLGDIAGNSKECRDHWLEQAIADPTTNCQHAGPGTGVNGAGTCGDACGKTTAEPPAQAPPCVHLTHTALTDDGPAARQTITATCARHIAATPTGRPARPRAAPSPRPAPTTSGRETPFSAA